MSARDVTSIGEGHLRLNAASGTALEQASELSVTVAGTEANVLGLLARLGNRTGLLTCLPANALGRRVVDEYRAAGIDTDAIIWREQGRLALYFVEHASPPVPSQVIYDRADSCFARLREDEIDWAYLADARLIHLTGITAALGEEMYAIVARAATQARQDGQLVSVDVNHRVRLSSAEAARERMAPLLESANVVFCSRRDAAAVFGIDGSASEVARAMASRFGAPTVLVSDGAGAVAAVAHGREISAQPPPNAMIDRVGAGDALIAGFLHGYLRDDPEAGVRLGIAAAALALTRFGDQVHTSLHELEQLCESLGGDIIR